MAVEIVTEVLWTPSATNSFDQIVQYLFENWTAKEVSTFVKRTAGVIDMLKRYPEMCSPSKKRKNVRVPSSISIRKWLIITNPGKSK